jgi:hypothetical protein
LTHHDFSGSAEAVGDFRALTFIAVMAWGAKMPR